MWEVLKTDQPQQAVSQGTIALQLPAGGQVGEAQSRA